MPEFGSADTLRRTVRETAEYWIIEQLDKWASQHANVEYRLHSRDWAVYIEFTEAKYITLFMLSWEPKKQISATNWKRISVTDTLERNEDTDQEPYTNTDQAKHKQAKSI